MEELLRQAAVIRDETVDNENSAIRVGTLFVDVIQRIQKIVSDEKVKTDSLKFGTGEDTMWICFDIVDESGNVKQKKIYFPIVSKQKTGVLTSLQFNDLTQKIMMITPILVTESEFKELKETDDLDPERFYYVYEEL